MSVSVTTAATETELRDAVDDIQVPCARCGKPASKILRCRTVTSQHVLVCRTCLLLLEATTVTAGHIHCGHCDDIGSQLADVAEVLEINGGGASLMTNPFDLLADEFPHGTIEGERRGCVASNCPAYPLQCKDVASRYRSDLKFKRLYMTGLRGQELVNALAIANGAGAELARAEKATAIAVVDDARIDAAAAQLKANPEPAAEPVDVPAAEQPKRKRARRLTEDEQRELLDRRQAGATLAELVEWMGCTTEVARNRLRSAANRFDVDVVTVDRPKRKPTLREELETELAAASTPGPENEGVAPDLENADHGADSAGPAATAPLGFGDGVPAGKNVPFLSLPKSERLMLIPEPELKAGSHATVRVTIDLEFDPLVSPWPLQIEADRIVIDRRGIGSEARP